MFRGRKINIHGQQVPYFTRGDFHYYFSNHAFWDPRSEIIERKGVDCPNSLYQVSYDKLPSTCKDPNDKSDYFDKTIELLNKPEILESKILGLHHHGIIRNIREMQDISKRVDIYRVVSHFELGRILYQYVINLFNSFPKKRDGSYRYEKPINAEFISKMEFMRDQFLNDANYLLHGHRKIIMQMMSSIATGLLACYLTGYDLTNLSTFPVVGMGAVMLAGGWGLPKAGYHLISRCSSTFFEAERKVDEFATRLDDVFVRSEPRA